MRGIERMLLGLVFLALAAAGCGGGSGGGGGGPTGTTAVVIKDAPIQVANETRTVIGLFVDIRRIELDRDRSGPDRGSDHDDDAADGEDDDGHDDDDGDDDEGHDGDGEGDGDDDGDDDHEDGDGDDGDDDADGDDDGADDNDESGDDRHEDRDDAVVFDADRDNGGVPIRIDLLTLTDSGQLIGTRQVRVGTYDEAEIEVEAAFAEFADDPGVLVPLVLGGDDDEADEFEFDLEPPVTVDANGTTIAVIDFAPIVTRDGTDYVLTHDDVNDDSGEDDDFDLDLHLGGIVTFVSSDHGTIRLDGVALDVDVSTADVEADALPDSRMSLAVGQTVEVEGALDLATGVIVASEVEIQ